MIKDRKLGSKVKELRRRKGWSQEDLKENSGLSLRTVQRIEKGETRPAGESLRRISEALDVTPKDLLGPVDPEDSSFAMMLNLSSLTFLLFPLLGFLVPLILWISKKDQVRGIQRIGKDVINFQITWFLILCLGLLFSSIVLAYRLDSPAAQLADSISATLGFNLGFIVLMYVLNILLIGINTYRIQNQKQVLYRPKFPFLRN